MAVGPVAQEVPLAHQPENLLVSGVLGGGQDDAQVFGRALDLDGRALVLGFAEDGLGFRVGTLVDFAYRAGGLGLAERDEVAHPDEFVARPLDGPIGIVGGVEARDPLKKLEQFAGLG